MPILQKFFQTPFYLNYIEKNLNMSVLKQKLDKAAQKFQTHCFKEALEAYEDCLSFCYRTDQSKQIIFNIMSAKGALLCILGEYEKSMTTLNEILKNQPNHYLALIRRSQVYKKRGKLNRAYKDIEIISNFCPDNLQLVAMKIQIENLRSKNKNVNSSEESDSEDIVDQEAALNFSTLKKIDRKSCSIMLPQQRKSRVTISGDTAFQYQINEDFECDKSNSTAFSKDNIKEKYQRTFKQIQSDQKNQESNNNSNKIVNVVVKSIVRTKSILKNRDVSITNQLKTKTQPQQYGGRESILIQKIKNIDGKMISSANSIPGSQKQVEFRKSIHFDMNAPNENIIKKNEVTKSKKRPTGRKSCLKRCSFEKVQQQVKKMSDKPIRRSKFQMLSRKSIDGHIIKNENSQQNKIIQKSNGSESDGDESQHNIFGNGQPVLSKQISQRFGLQQEKKVQKEKAKKGRSNGGKSILKKSSILSNDVKKSNQAGKNQQENKVQIIKKKVKKSVMFTKSRFAE